MTTTPSPKEDPSDTTTAEFQDAVGPDRGDVPTDHLDLPVDAQLLGVDGDGDTHLHSPRADLVVVVTPDGDVVHEQALEPGDVEHWIDHTEECRGEWDDLRYVTGADDPLAAVVARAIEMFEEESDR
jgi:hypothetical protein